VTTVGRILKEPPRAIPTEAAGSTGRVVTAKRANHVWHTDLTTVPRGAGFWAPWLPFALPQCWPFCWWLVVVIDHYSRRALGFSVLPRRPTPLAMRSLLGRMVARANATPKYLVCDKDSVFWCGEFKRWCRHHRIRPRYGAVGQHGSIAVVERFIRTMKDEGTRRILVAHRRSTFGRALAYFFAWYNAYRPTTQRSRAGRPTKSASDCDLPIDNLASSPAHAGRAVRPAPGRAR
jgi:transposase InsO family protein